MTNFWNSAGIPSSLFSFQAEKKSNEGSSKLHSQPPTNACGANRTPTPPETHEDSLVHAGFLLRITVTDFHQTHQSDWDPLTWNPSGLLVELRGKNCTPHQIVPNEIKVAYEGKTEETSIPLPAQKALYHNDEFYFRIQTRYVSTFINKKNRIKNISLIDVLGNAFDVEKNSLKTFLQAIDRYIDY